MNFSPALFLLLAFSLPPASAADHGFTFTGPALEGWAEAPPENGEAFLSLAGDGSGNFNANLGKGRLEVNDSLLAEMRGTMAKEMVSGGITDAQILEAGIVEIGGVQCLRMLSKGTFSGVPMNQLIYVLPGGEYYASLTYTSVPESFEANLPAFEESAKRTGGLVSHKKSAGSGTSTGSYILYGALIGGLVQALYVLYKKMSA